MSGRYHRDSLTYWILEGDGPLSPFTNVPWATLVTGALWILAVVLGRPGDSPVTNQTLMVAWILAIAGYAFYLYKIAENAFIVFKPEAWWSYPYLSKRGKQGVLRAAGIWDAVDLLFVAAWAANGLMMHAIYETYPAGVPVLALTATPLERLVRLSTTIAFAGFGTGFTSVLPVGASVELLTWILSAVQLFVSTLVAANLIGIAAERRSQTVGGTVSS